MDIKTIINEEIQELFENLEIYTIPQLAQTLSKLDYDQNGINIVTNMLWDAYKEGGDDAVVDMYTKMAGVEIQALRNGRYVFHNLTGGGKPHVFGTAGNRNSQLQEIQDNANHCPDEMPS